MLLQLISPAYAQVNIGEIFGPVKNSESFRTVGGFVSVLLPNILTVAGVITLIIVVASGINMIANAGSGDAQQLEKNQKAFTAAVIGLLLIFAAFFIIKLISIIVGFDILSPPIQSSP